MVLATLELADVDFPIVEFTSTFALAKTVIRPVPFVSDFEVLVDESTRTVALAVLHVASIDATVDLNLSSILLAFLLLSGVHCIDDSSTKFTVIFFFKLLAQRLLDS